MAPELSIGGNQEILNTVPVIIDDIKKYNEFFMLASTSNNRCSERQNSPALLVCIISLYKQALRGAGI